MTSSGRKTETLSHVAEPLANMCVPLGPPHSHQKQVLATSTKPQMPGWLAPVPGALGSASSLEARARARARRTPSLAACLVFSASLFFFSSIKLSRNEIKSSYSVSENTACIVVIAVVFAVVFAVAVAAVVVCALTRLAALAS